MQQKNDYRRFYTCFLFVPNGFLSKLYGEHDGVLTYTETNKFALNKVWERVYPSPLTQSLRMTSCYDITI